MATKRRRIGRTRRRRRSKRRLRITFSTLLEHELQQVVQVGVILMLVLGGINISTSTRQHVCMMAGYVIRDL